MDVQRRASELIEAVRSGEEGDELRPRQGALLQTWEAADELARTHVVAAVAQALSDPSIDPGPGAALAITAGALVERGADPSCIGQALLERLPAVLTMVQRFQDRCLAVLPEEPEDGDESEEEAVEILDRAVPMTILREHAGHDPNGAAAWEASNQWALPTIACMTRDRELRAVARRRPELRQLADATQGYNGFLTMVLDILDDETLVVLHPQSNQGFEVAISGIAGNFDLHLLLADLLIREGDDGPVDGIRGHRPNPIAVRNIQGEVVEGELGCVGSWNLHDWRAAQDSGTLAEDSDLWIWNEGRPADIPEFEGQRVDPMP